MTLTKKEAQARFGSDWTKHLAETDHIHPLEKVHGELKDYAFLTNDDIREFANSSDNLQVTSRQLNNAKRSRTNEEFMADAEYLEREGITLSDDAKREAVEIGEQAKKVIHRKAAVRSVKNATITFHNAGLDGAKQSGLAALTMSGIMNITAVIKGEKEADEAALDTLKAGGAGAAAGYVMSGGLTALSQGLSNSANELVKSVANSNLPGQIITAVMIAGGTLKRYASGELDTEEVILELGDKGAGFAAGSYGFAAGQALIPVPIVGGIVGSMVGYMLASTFYGGLKESLTGEKLTREEERRIERECREAIRAVQEFRERLETLISGYFIEHIKVFHKAFDTMKEALGIGDVDGFIAGTNMITQKLGGRVQFRNMREFDSLMMSSEAFVL